MKTNAFIVLGDNLFNKLNNKKIKCDFCSILNNKLILKIDDFFIQNIFLGWSFIIFKTEHNIFHSGFQQQIFKQKDINKIFESFCIDQISNGVNTSYCISTNGNLFQYSNKDFKPKQLKCENKEVTFKSVDTEDLYTVALSNDGKVFEIKEEIEDKIIELSLPLIIEEVACGKEHVLLLSNTGVIISYGAGSRGQLGHGNINKVDHPLIMEALEGVQIKQISAGGWHSAAVSSEGDLYMWGWNESGQLGLPCITEEETLKDQLCKVCCLPVIIDLNNCKIRSVSCGSRHTAAITEDNAVWTWGWNGYNQLGIETCSFSGIPSKRDILPPMFIPKNIKCKFWNTLIAGYFEK